MPLRTQVGRHARQNVNVLPTMSPRIDSSRKKAKSGALTVLLARSNIAVELHRARFQHGGSQGTCQTNDLGHQQTSMAVPQVGRQRAVLRPGTPGNRLKPHDCSKERRNVLMLEAQSTQPLQESRCPPTMPKKSARMN